MKSNTIKITGILFISLFATFNLYQSYIKNNRNINNSNVFSSSKGLLNTIAYGEDFPEDPFKGENSGEDKYEKRTELQCYEYLYVDLNKTENGEAMYSAYKTPVTIVDCMGHGDVNCTKGRYFGMTENLGEVKESEKKKGCF